MSTRWFGKLLLDKYFRASKKEATSMIPMLSLSLRIMTHPLIVTPLYSMKIFALKTFANCLKIVKFVKVFHLRKIPATRYLLTQGLNVCNGFSRCVYTVIGKFFWLKNILLSKKFVLKIFCGFCFPCFRVVAEKRSKHSQIIK